MKRKIIAIGLMMCLSISLLLPIQTASESGKITMNYLTDGFITAVIRNNTDDSENPLDYGLANVTNTSSLQYRWVIPMHFFDIDPYEVTTLILSIMPQNIDNAGNITIYALASSNGSICSPSECNWTYAEQETTWVNPGGDKGTALDTKYISSAGQFYDFNATNYTQLNTDDQVGFIIEAEYNCDMRFYVTSIAGFKMELSYVGGGTKTSTITANTWTWLGYLNGTSKTGAALYSEITNCSYIVMQNTTSGYYYTYGPGITEDFNVTYGSAIAILTTSEETWDHT